MSTGFDFSADGFITTPAIATSVQSSPVALIASTRTFPSLGEENARLVDVDLGIESLLTSGLGLSSPDAALLQIVDLRFQAQSVVKFSFLRQRRERHLFDGTRAKRDSIKPRGPAKTPAPPPEHDGLSLEDRLRWILTPPIQEELADPQLTLPEHPYPYQMYGIKWLMDRESALLADEMGLGKTMQAIVAARLLWRERKIHRILVVCPKPLISTWQQELDKWWPSAVPNTRLLSGDRQFFLRLGTDNVTIKIVNYEAIAKEADWLRSQKFSHDLVIIDEAQRIKNANAKTAQAVKALHATRRWALTGTPLENKIDDLLSIFEFIKPQYLLASDVKYVRERIQPYFLRRKADEVLKDLPDKEDQDVPINLDGEQRDAYERAERDGVVELNAKGDIVTIQHVFVLIQKLIQICNFEPIGKHSCKLDRMAGDLEEIIESKRKVLIFSQYVSEPFGLKQLKRVLPKLCNVVEMHGQVPAGQRDTAVRSFNNDDQVNTMLLHYRVGGLGLNLQAANYVYLFDRWWNPAVEDQAVKRAHRLGQKSKVFIRRLFCKDTIEERILSKLAEKRRLFALVIDDERPDAAAMGLSEEEVFALFPGLTVRPKRTRPTGEEPKLVLDNMDPRQFEELVAKILEAQGFKTKLVGGSHDGGIDVVAEKVAGHGRERIVVQCKHQQANVGRPEIQKLWGVINDDSTITRGEVVTSSGFTAEAIGFAANKRMTLVGRDKLIKEAERLKVAKFV